MDCTQRISEPLLESDDEEENEEETQNKRGKPLAKLLILKNDHIPEAELPLFLGDNVLGRDPNSCTLVLSSPSVSKQHANICISRYRRRGSRGEVDMEALVWDKGSMNGTHRGYLKLTPNVRYALNEGDSLLLADIPCQYISCSVDATCFQGQSRTSVSRQSGVQARMSNSSREDESGTSNTSTKPGTNTSAPLSSPDQDDVKKTLVQRSCLTFEQTPTHPERTLVPESDSDSDDERERTRNRVQITAVSDGDSLICSPTCPTNTKTIIPESEDEFSIIHSCTKNRPDQDVSVCKDQTDMETMQQQNEHSFVGGEEEERKLEERGVLGGSEEEEGGRDVKQSVYDRLTGEDEVPVSAPAVPMDQMAVFDMGSDTDAEGEEGVMSVGSVAINANKVNTVPFHMESDTDVEDDHDDSLDKVPKAVPSCDDGTKSPCAPPVIQLPDIALDSDTDVDDDDANASTTKTSPTSLQTVVACVPLTQLKDFHLDSDTDAEEEKQESEMNKTGQKMIEIPIQSDLKPSEFESTSAVPRSLDRDTDNEVNPAISKCPAVALAADLEILSNSDTDLEDDAPCLQNAAAKALSVTPVAASTSLHSDSDADTDVNESNGPSAEGVTDLRLGCGAQLEKEQCDEGHIPQPEPTSPLPVPELQMCSTPRQFSGEVAEMETQAFVSSPLEPPKCTPAPSVRPAVCSGNQDDDSVLETQPFIVESQDCPATLSDEPTQAFGLDSSEDENHDDPSSRGGSVQLGLSDSNHLQCQDQALAMESTQAYVDGSLSLEETQGYGGDEEPENFENDDWDGLALQATQAYIPEVQSLPEDKRKKEEIKSISAETQLIEFPTATDFAVAETQPIFALEEERDGTKDNPLLCVQHVAMKNHNETKDATNDLDKSDSQGVLIAETQPMVATEDEETDDDASLLLEQKRKAKPLPLEEETTQSFTNSEVSAVDTQPTHGSDVKIQATEDDRVSFPVPLEGEETQTCTNSERSAVDIQVTHDDEVKSQSTADEDSFPGLQKRKAKPLSPEEEESQVSVPDTQPMHIDNDETHRTSANEKEESDDENSIPHLQKRKVRPLPPEEEDTQVSVADTQPIHIDDETQAVHALEKKENASIPGSCNRKENPQELEEEETQRLKNSDLSVADTQPMQDSDEETQHVAMCEDGKTDNEDSNLGHLKRKGKTQTSKEVTHVSAVETQPIYPDDDDDDDEEEETSTVESNIGIQITQSQPKCGRENPFEAGTSGTDMKSKKGTRATTKEGGEDKDSDPPRKKTRGKSKSLSFTQVCTAKFKPDAVKENEEQVQHCRTTSPRQQKDEDKERLEMKEEKMAEANLLEVRDGISERTGKVVEERHSIELSGEYIRIQCEKDQLKCAKMEKQSMELKEEEKLHQEREKRQTSARKETDLKEREERESKGKLIKGQKENKELSTRGRRGGRTSTAPACEPEQKPDSGDDFPARRTRSRSSSCNSVTSEKSASSANTPVSRGRGRGRGTRRTSRQTNVTITRKDNKERTVAEEVSAPRWTATQDSDAVSPSGHLLRSAALKSEISRRSTNSENRGKGHSQRGRGRKTEAQPDAVTPVRSSAPTATLRGRRSKMSEGSSLTSLLHRDDEEANSKRCSTTRGQKRANTNGSESTAAHGEEQPSQEGESSSESLLLLRTSNRGRKAVKSDSLATQSLVTAASQEDEARSRRKRDLVEEILVSTPKKSRGNGKAQKGKTVLEESDEKEEVPVSVKAKRRGRPAGKSVNESLQKVEVKEESDKVEEGMVVRRASGRLSVVHKKKKHEPEDSSSMEQDTNLETSEQSQTPSSSVSRKRRASVDSSSSAKIPCSSPASRLRAASPVCRFCVLFTGVVDDAWEKAVVHLGGIIAKDVTDMNYLVTDKVRRTVKFLCAVAKGVPIVTPLWLEKSAKAESFLSPNGFIVKDLEHEKKFNFCLKESLRLASRQPLLQGYEIHVTKSVKPEPVYMKDIISCSGATFLPKMPSSHKSQSVVISCEEDWALCAPAVSASLPVVTAEFILTGILQQKVDLQTHTLSAPPSKPQPAGGRGRARKKP